MNRGSLFSTSSFEKFARFHAAWWESTKLYDRQLWPPGFVAVDSDGPPLLVDQHV